MHITIINDSLNVYQKFTINSPNKKNKLSQHTNRIRFMPNYRNDLKRKERLPVFTGRSFIHS